MQAFTLPAKDRDPMLTRIGAFLRALPEKPYSIEVKQRKNTRTIAQNRYLWGVCYQTILEHGGESLAGWTRDDLHEYFLGEHFGWETLEGFGRKRLKPVNRSSSLSKMEFVDFVDFIQRKAAELGIFIPDADGSV